RRRRRRPAGARGHRPGWPVPPGQPWGALARLHVPCPERYVCFRTRSVRNPGMLGIVASTLPARLLRLLSLLQSRREWAGGGLATGLGVTSRTVRRDVDRLRQLGYPVDGTTGIAGGYRLASGSNLPPLLLDDEEAIAVVVGLRA